MGTKPYPDAAGRQYPGTATALSTKASYPRSRLRLLRTCATLALSSATAIAAAITSRVHAPSGQRYGCSTRGWMDNSHWVAMTTAEGCRAECEANLDCTSARLVSHYEKCWMYGANFVNNWASGGGMAECECGPNSWTGNSNMYTIQCTGSNPCA